MFLRAYLLHFSLFQLTILCHENIGRNYIIYFNRILKDGKVLNSNEIKLVVDNSYIDKKGKL